MLGAVSRSTWKGMIVAVALVAAALIIRYPLTPWLGRSVPYLQFFPAILVAGRYGGFGPGAVATGMAGLAASGFPFAAAKPSRASSDSRAIAPKPCAAVRRMSRRVVFRPQPSFIAMLLSPRSRPAQ